MGKLLKSYIFWTHERGSFHYDVIVTLILLFLFVSPRFINFGDKPVEPIALKASEVLVKEAGPYRFIFEVRADSVGPATDDAALREAMLRQIEPIAGEVTWERYEPVRDPNGKVIAYDAYVRR